MVGLLNSKFINCIFVKPLPSTLQRKFRIQARFVMHRYITFGKIKQVDVVVKKNIKPDSHSQLVRVSRDNTRNDWIPISTFGTK